ncbi:MAG: PopZ family protein [Mesorhizobium sp.]|nr:PopZ family protein [Mesorhizobium sp.]MCO5163666.1 PopZ family protein [Mesorhizobium sp.]
MASQAAEAVVQQLGGAQREPSMEEILASIRRIIEDSDTTRTAQETAFPAAANTSSPSMGARDIETFREELHASSEPAAVVRPATPLSAEADQVTKPAVEVESVVAAEPKNAPSPRSERPLQTVTVEPAGDAGARSEWNQRPASPIAAPAPAPAPVSSSPSPASLPDTPRSSIISEVAGRQVAAAFGELSDAFAASRRRSFDEIAEEMMRPMLQDWLDNNLPTLVERLVREEIERVARGGAG